MNCKDFSNFLSNLSGYELVLISTFLSFTIASNLESNEISTLGDFFSSLGQNLSTIGSSLSNQ